MNTYRHALILAALLLFCATSVAAPDAKRQVQLERLLAQDCGACHGLYLTGGLGPELTRAALADESRASLIATITHGRPGTAMPGWGPLLSADDIRWLVDFLLQGYPAP
ncbi:MULTISPECIES: cytochrome c [unclassified Pseudomonas]|uniref:c-type cytochrome n=1 Tax=unclassified Pseudomonas TaxID=196821 RepID=UPI002AC8A6D4|nr:MULTISPECIES: cytochrome c [unclassified Pseudomonas]MEB0046688.1 cytochrome c [Pseudomonas sp. Dout3]MEB0098570.1 cytochrome c [Pseudomonas sp. DC1.2]WPX56656.1 cytochrome c [Pseudomonas sp. DC1.2]